MVRREGADRKRVAVLISGRGSNMAALIYAARSDDCPFEIVLVASDRPDAPGLTLAEAEEVAVERLTTDKAAIFGALDTLLREREIDIVALAGFMRILPADFVERWAGRIVNIHPSLLPSHRGLRTHEAVLAAGERVTGCTVHEVTVDLDDGPILGRTEVAVLPGDTVEMLAERVLIAEHQLYPRALALFVARDVTPGWLLDKVRDNALALPEAEEKLSHGSPAFFVKGGKVFAYFSANHHGDDRIAVLVKVSGLDEQQMLIEQDQDRYFRPAYFGDSWVGIRLDLADTDWDNVGDRIAQSWEMAAPRRLLEKFGR
jgi:formyltetrahydrofolate-dependent phosphoribosylglycinamide formyltransferase